jgi:hypothetical protein
MIRCLFSLTASDLACLQRRSPKRTLALISSKDWGLL